MFHNPQYLLAETYQASMILQICITSYSDPFCFGFSDSDLEFTHK